MVRQGDESEEEETYSYIDELVMASKDNADIFGADVEKNNATDGIDNAVIFEPAAENNDTVSSVLQVDEELVAAAENNDAAPDVPAMPAALEVDVVSVAVNEVSCIDNMLCHQKMAAENLFYTFCSLIHL